MQLEFPRAQTEPPSRQVQDNTVQGLGLPPPTPQPCLLRPSKPLSRPLLTPGPGEPSPKTRAASLSDASLCRVVSDGSSSSVIGGESDAPARANKTRVPCLFFVSLLYIFQSLFLGEIMFKSQIRAAAIIQYARGRRGFTVCVEGTHATRDERANKQRVWKIPAARARTVSRARPAQRCQERVT